ncbi:MAG: class I SAM-dependent methyltransferase, partial [Propionibacteriaceae bacterium]|nr:class I SAM-dependent methyltransferase [Propionibacteriaceae bacterium]
MTADNASEAIGEDEPTDAELSEVFGARVGLVREYQDLLATTGLQWGLLGPREAERLWSRHILNSVAIASLIPEGASVLDVGSGAGLPGIPLALARPDLHVTLLDSLLRRAKFLQ